MKIEKGYKPLFDNGHSDILLGEYKPLTGGKQYQHPGENMFYEGRFNRYVEALIRNKVAIRKVPFGHVSPELTDTPLSIRRKRANEFYAKDKKVYLFSIHGNGGKGVGIEGYTSKGETGSDYIMDYILKQIESKFSHVTKMRFDWSDKDRDKERDFAVLLCNPYAMLIELGFFDNKKDYGWMTDEDSLELLTDIIADAISNIYFNGIE